MLIVSNEFGVVQGLVTSLDVLEVVTGKFPDEDEMPEIEVHDMEGSADGFFWLRAQVESEPRRSSMIHCTTPALPPGCRPRHFSRIAAGARHGCGASSLSRIAH
ncbi:hypothetical protein [Sodalis-like endosymbiont of Proechinophthirus fluctus]|uniref:hypothetical protein n=1 Tax=Sodalis-like endosymbiont of Proechinophthirus fluctus TaxID=1462730 RepID=UPI000830D34F|nr:hypothetical protein [Sodalis-like endosymbiont of Proechinophthirus fluctus]